MSAVYLKTFGTFGTVGFWAAILPSEMALSRLHNFIDGISPFELKRTTTGGPGRGPRDRDTEPHNSIWDDPALWMLIVH